jgi:hypothetical protein
VGDVDTPEAQEFTARRGVRVALLAAAGFSMLAGLYAALLLIADREPTAAQRLPDVHGILMVLGSLGTLVALERSVALRRPWGYAAPLALGLGGIALVVPIPLIGGRLPLILGCALAMAVLVQLWRRQEDDPTAAQILGAAMALGAAILWTRLDVADLLPWLVGYIVLTIAAERVELARLTMPPCAGRVLLGAAAALLMAGASTLMWPAVAARVFGAVIVALVFWLARSDVARRTIRSTGLPRFSAAALLSGYGWLAVAGVVWVVTGMPRALAAYDTVVHATFLGFAMSMVMAHAPVIFPSVLRRPLPYRSAMWIPLGLLQIGLIVRIGVGDGLGLDGPWQIGAVLNVVALLLFAGTAAWSVRAGRPTRRMPALRGVRGVRGVRGLDGAKGSR